jgi:chorismate synthase
MGKTRAVGSITQARQTVPIDLEQYIAVRRRSDLTGVPVAVLIRRAVALWLDADAPPDVPR